MNAPASSEDTTWAMLCHLAAFSGVIVPVPFMNIVGPLIVWQLKKDSPFVDAHGKEALNFNISIAIALAVLIAVGTILMVILVGLLFYLAAAIISLAAIVLVIMAAIKASKGEYYQYPFIIRFVK